MTRFLWICLAGAMGTGARYLLSAYAAKLFGAAFPYGTLAVNVLGSYLLGAATYVGLESSALPATLRLSLTIGFMGGFTTFSTFSFETLRYLQEGAWELCFLNVGLNVVGSLGACFLGWASGKWLVGF